MLKSFVTEKLQDCNNNKCINKSILFSNPVFVCYQKKKIINTINYRKSRLILS